MFGYVWDVWDPLSLISMLSMLSVQIESWLSDDGLGNSGKPTQVVIHVYSRREANQLGGHRPVPVLEIVSPK